nr:MAG TPA: hypothetical protein [Caudoviricetes sp.]
MERLKGAIPWGFLYALKEVNPCQQNPNGRAV